MSVNKLNEYLDSDARVKSSTRLLRFNLDVLEKVCDEKKITVAPPARRTKPRKQDYVQALLAWLSQKKSADEANPVDTVGYLQPSGGSSGGVQTNMGEASPANADVDMSDSLGEIRGPPPGQQSEDMDGAPEEPHNQTQKNKRKAGKSVDAQGSSRPAAKRLKTAQTEDLGRKRRSEHRQITVQAIANRDNPAVLQEATVELDGDKNLDLRELERKFSLQGELHVSIGELYEAGDVLCS
ncbi:hypothetical protein H0H93_011540 [Arthromyces matolae]|nr:hypothetical protein H0H93_011540 [Arthromyces matolae]